MKRLFLLGLVLVILAVLVLPRLLLPPIIENSLAELLESQLGGTITVNVETRYGWELVRGRFSTISIEGNDGNWNGLPIAFFRIIGQDVEIDLRLLLETKQFSYRGLQSFAAELRITEADLNQYFWHELDPNQFFRIDLLPNQAALNGTFELWQIDWNVSLLNELEIFDQTKISIKPVDFLIFDTRVPAVLLELISGNYTLVLDLSGLPIPIKLDRIELTDEELILYGSEAF